VEQVPRDLIERANRGGGHDNITAVIIRVGEDAPDEAGERAVQVSLKIEVLKGLQLFRYLSYKELVRVMNITEGREYGEGEDVIREGDPGDAMYVVLSGTVRLHKGGVTVTTLGKGQHFGEMALVDRTQRSLTATAMEPSRLLYIRRKDFYALIKKEPSLSVKLLWSFVQVLAERLRKTTAELSGARRGDRSPPPETGGPGEPLFHE
jgi:hypothetical protein